MSQSTKDVVSPISMQSTDPDHNSFQGTAGRSDIFFLNIALCIFASQVAAYLRILFQLLIGGLIILNPAVMYSKTFSFLSIKSRILKEKGSRKKKGGGSGKEKYL